MATVLNAGKEIRLDMKKIDKYNEDAIVLSENADNILTVIAYDKEKLDIATSKANQVIGKLDLYTKQLVIGSGVKPYYVGAREKACEYLDSIKKFQYEKHKRIV